MKDNIKEVNNAITFLEKRLVELIGNKDYIKWKDNGSHLGSLFIAKILAEYKQNNCNHIQTIRMDSGKIRCIDCKEIINRQCKHISQIKHRHLMKFRCEDCGETIKN